MKNTKGKACAQRLMRCAYQAYKIYKTLMVRCFP